MSVLVKDMEMPTSCNKCPFSVNGFCVVSPKRANGKAMSERVTTNWCPLIEIPPHGRLIDADALDKKCEEMRSIEWNNKAAPYSWAYAYENFQDDIENAPTIIPADGGDPDES